MTPEMIGFALVLVGVLLLVGKFLRLRWKAAQRLFLPSSVLAGFVALLVGPGLLGRVTGDEGPFAEGLFPAEVLEVWEALPELLITVVFATLFLGHRIPPLGQVWRYGGPQLSLGVSLGAGQYVVGILLTLAVLTPLFGMNPMAGALIEIGFEGGHGTAAGLEGTFADLGFEEGRDLALGLATVGIVSGVVIGIGLVNWAARRGHTAIISGSADVPDELRDGVVALDNRAAAAQLTVRPSSVEPLSIHMAVVGAAILVGLGLLELLQLVENVTWGPAGVELIEHVPLFPLAMIGGVIVQLAVDRFDRRSIVDRGMMLRIQGLALDTLILTALATIALDVIGEHLVPFVLLAAAGIAWNVLIFLVFARRIVPEFWFERGIADFGQSMGVTATGLVLLRVVDGENETPALEAFGYKQLGFEPFLGGGLVTALSLPLIAQFGPLPLLGVMTVLLLLALGTGVFYFGRMTRAPAAGRGR